MLTQKTPDGLPVVPLTTAATDTVEGIRLTALWEAMRRKAIEAATAVAGLDIVPPEEALAAITFAEVLLDAAAKVRQIGEAEGILHEHLCNRAMAILDRVCEQQAAQREEVPIA